MTGEEFILIVQRLFKGGLENTRSIHKESVYNKQKLKKDSLHYYKCLSNIRPREKTHSNLGFLPHRKCLAQPASCHETDRTDSGKVSGSGPMTSLSGLTIVYMKGVLISCTNSA